MRLPWKGSSIGYRNGGIYTRVNIRQWLRHLCSEEQGASAWMGLDAQFNQRCGGYFLSLQFGRLVGGLSPSDEHITIDTEHSLLSENTWPPHINPCTVTSAISRAACGSAGMIDLTDRPCQGSRLLTTTARRPTCPHVHMTASSTRWKVSTLVGTSAPEISDLCHLDV